MNNDYILKLDNPAEEWENTSPIGCGNLGATFFGHIIMEELVLNEESIWSKPIGLNCNNYAEKIDRLKSQVRIGNMLEADKIAKEVCPDTNKIRSYETAGRLLLRNMHDMPLTYSDYSREIDLMRGIYSLKYKFGNVKYIREAFASHKRNVIALRLSSAAEDGIRFDMKYLRDSTNTTVTKNTIKVTGLTQFGNKGFCVGIKVLNEGGKLTSDKVSISVDGAKSVTVFIRITTELKSAKYQSECMSELAKDTDYDLLKEEHIAEFYNAMSRSNFSLKQNTTLTRMPANKRIKKIKSGVFEDDNMAELYYQFGKYLLMSSSRNGGYPANLQGVWNESLTPKWQSDYHININLQMNYWGANVANIASETINPLFDFMNKVLLPSGKHTAKTIYNSLGTVAHHTTDIYGETSLLDGLCGAWPFGFVWLSISMWQHYLFTKDESFLRNQAYNCIKENVLFMLSHWEQDENGTLQSLFSISPENSYFLPSKSLFKKKITVAKSCAMDIQLTSALFKSYIEMENILNIDKDLKLQTETALNALPKLKIGSDGRLLEWQDEYKEVDKGHRHISHAFALYPDNAITKDSTPAEFEAIRKSIEYRLQKGGGHTGWSRTWIIAMYARLKDGENAYKHLQLLLKKSTLPNLFDNHPPFQIDGNLGGMAVIAEMLLQSHEGYLELLPAVPKKWLTEGEFTGLVARGNFEVTAKWKKAKITNLTVKSNAGGILKLKISDLLHPVSCNTNGSTIPLQIIDNTCSIETCLGQTITILTE